MSVGYKAEQIESIAAKLRVMPPVQKKLKEHTKQEAIKILAGEIKSMQERGYTLDEISETLRGEGIAITTTTLKSYMQRAKPARKRKEASPKAEATANTKAIREVKKNDPPIAAKGKFVPPSDSTNM